MIHVINDANYYSFYSLLCNQVQGSFSNFDLRVLTHANIHKENSNSTTRIFKEIFKNVSNLCQSNRINP